MKDVEERHGLMPSRKRKLLLWGGCGIILLGGGVMGCRTMYDVGRITSSSMSPTLLSGDVILYKKGGPPAYWPKEGDILLFRAPEGGKKVVVKRMKKRLPRGTVVELPQQAEDSIAALIRRDGGQVVYRHGTSYINGRRTSRYRLQQDFYYVLGDNASASYDSRSFGPIAASSVVGRMGGVLFSIDVSALGWHRLRWQRTCRFHLP